MHNAGSLIDEPRNVTDEFPGLIDEAGRLMHEVPSRHR